MHWDQCSYQLIIGFMINALLFLFLLYILFVFILRAMLGEKIHKSSAFWFYLSSLFLTAHSFPVFWQLFFNTESLCQIACLSFQPAQCANHVTLVLFIFFKLDLLKPDRILHGPRSKKPKSFLETMCFLLLGFYVIATTVKFITIIALSSGSRCFRHDEPFGCLAETDPSMDLRGTILLPIRLCEVILFFILIKNAADFYYNNDIEDNQWIQTEVITKIYWYSATSIVTLLTNLAFFFALVIVRFDTNTLDKFNSSEFCGWIIFMNIGVIYIAINVAMVTLCFPFRSFNVYYLLQAICGDRSFSRNDSIPFEINPELIRQYYEVEMASRQMLHENTVSNSGNSRETSVKNGSVVESSGQKRHAEHSHRLDTSSQVLETPSHFLGNSSDSESSSILITSYVLGSVTFAKLRE